MKYVVTAIFLAVGYSAWILSDVPNAKVDPSIEVPAQEAMTPALAAAKPSPVPDRVTEVSAEIEKLSNQLAEVDQELTALGYPDVMLDERLSEAERERIVDKVLTANRIHNVITMLTLKRIDLQAGL